MCDRKNYIALGKNYEKLWNFFGKIIDLLPHSFDDKVLDIGTGWGKLAAFLSFNYKLVITGEPTTFSKKKWQNRAEKISSSSRIMYLHYNAEILPFRDAIFDQVFIYAAFHFITNKIAAMREIYRICRLLGWLIIIELIPRRITSLKSINPNHPNFADPEKYSPWKEFPIYSLHEGDLFCRIYQKSSRLL